MEARLPGIESFEILLRIRIVVILTTWIDRECWECRRERHDAPGRADRVQSSMADQSSRHEAASGCLPSVNSNLKPCSLSRSEKMPAAPHLSRCRAAGIPPLGGGDEFSELSNSVTQNRWLRMNHWKCSSSCTWSCRMLELTMSRSSSSLMASRSRLMKVV